MKLLTQLLARFRTKPTPAKHPQRYSDAEFMDLPMRTARERTMLEQQKQAAEEVDREAGA